MIALRAACVITIFAFFHKRRPIPPEEMGRHILPSMGGAAGEDGGGTYPPTFVSWGDRREGIINGVGLFVITNLRPSTAQITCLEIDSAITMDWCNLSCQNIGLIAASSCPLIILNVERF